jgi:acylphosphatase
MTVSPGRVRRHVWASGRVQGVWFRDSCAREATAVGLAGSVRNLPDGRVEAVFEGSPEAVEALVAWCRVGPPGARVRDLETRDELPTGETGFRVF